MIVRDHHQNLASASDRTKQCVNDKEHLPRIPGFGSPCWILHWSLQFLMLGLRFGYQLRFFNPLVEESFVNVYVGLRGCLVDCTKPNRLRSDNTSGHTHEPDASFSVFRTSLISVNQLRPSLAVNLSLVQVQLLNSRVNPYHHSFNLHEHSFLLKPHIPLVEPQIYIGLWPCLHH